MIGTKEVMHGCCTTTGLGSHALTQHSQNRQILYWVTKHGDRSQIMEQISQRQGFIEMCRDSNEQPLKFLMSLMKTDHVGDWYIVGPRGKMSESYQAGGKMIPNCQLSSACFLLYNIKLLPTHGLISSR